APALDAGDHHRLCLGDAHDLRLRALPERVRAARGDRPEMTFLPTTNATVIGYPVAVVPDPLTGRVNSAARTIALGGAPFGPLSAGLLLSATSPRLTIAAYALFLVVPALIGTWSPSIRNAPSLSELDELPAPVSV